MVMKYTTMYQAIKKVLDKDEQIDYAMSGDTAALIELWSRVYAGQAPWLDKTTDSAGIAASVSMEIARLVTLEMQSKVEGSGRASYLDKTYQSVLGKLRVQTEYAFAKGNMAFKPYVTPSGISVQYIQADHFFPLSFDTEQITDCAFLDQFRRGDEIYSRIERHTLRDGQLIIRNKAFMSRTGGVLGSEVQIGRVSTWRSFVTMVHARSEGERVGYGGAVALERNAVLATVGVGYGDGLTPALASAKAPVLIGGKRCTLLACCMDQCLIDVTGVDCRPGDEAVFFGYDRFGNCLPSQEVALLIGGDEGCGLTAALSPRVVRTYSF